MSKNSLRVIFCTDGCQTPYKGKLIIKPAKSSVKRFLADIREKIKLNKTAKTENLIRLLNPKIRGWANYYSHVCSKRAFNYVDSSIFKAIWRWVVRRHPNKSTIWIKRKYFRRDRLRNWVFSANVYNKYKISICLDLIKMQKVPIKRHIKIRSAATPYNPDYHEYLEKRVLSRIKEGNPQKRPLWWLCWWNLIGAPIN